jgi:murein DD-endopeptidase MepM/ murein hydrolase activator NlpD
MRKLVYLILIILVWTAIGGESARRRTYSQPQNANTLRKKLQVIESKKMEARLNLRLARRQEKIINAKLQVQKEQLEQTRQNLREVSGQLQQKQVELSQAQQSLKKSDRKLTAHQQALSERLEQIYQSGDSGLLEVLFQSSSYADLENRLYQIDKVMDLDASLLDNYEEARAARADAAETAAQTEECVAELKDAVAQKHAVATQQKQNTEIERQQIVRARAAWEKEADSLEEDSREIGAMLRRLQTTTAGRLRYSRPFTGGLMRPVSGGRITSSFGWRVHPIYKSRKFHSGVDIAISSGTPIHAAAKGLVLHAGWWGGYGNCVIIDHGGGVATLYGHCSSLAVSAGQEVRQGQTIGFVGSTGLSTGPHVHFEVQRNGQAVSPF